LCLVHYRSFPSMLFCFSTFCRTRPSALFPYTTLFRSIERGEYPEWELLVQMMSDDEHPELDFDPLDDTKTWPEQDFPPKPVGRIDRKSTRLNSSHVSISYAVFCLKKKKTYTLLYR